MDNNVMFEKMLEGILKSVLSNGKPPELNEETAKIAAQGMKKMFDAFISAGFTETQAFTMIGMLLNVAFNGGKRP